MKNILLEIEMQHDNFYNDFKFEKNLKLLLEFGELGVDWHGKKMKFTAPKFKKKSNIEIVNARKKPNKNKLF